MRGDSRLDGQDSPALEAILLYELAPTISSPETFKATNSGHLVLHVN